MISRSAAWLCFSAGLVFGQRGDSKIQDNSFLVEEAYNQERGVVQHISTFSRMWNSKDWSYTFTQEWPVPSNWRHQLSYTLSGAHAGGISGSGAGLGDVILNYRFQAVGDGESRIAVSPRISLLLPTGNVTRGRGNGSAGLQSNIPVSVVVNRRLVTHWNIGNTWMPRAQNADHYRAAASGYTFGQSFVVVANSRVNLLLETMHSRFQSVVGDGRTAWGSVTYVSPGVRWAYNLPSGLQVVPGVAMPIGVGPTGGERGLFLYLSLEHPIGKAAR